MGQLCQDGVGRNLVREYGGGGGGAQSAETKLAVSRVISWIKEAKSPEIKRVSGVGQLCNKCS